MQEAIDLAPTLDPFSPAAQLVLIALNCRLPFEDYEAVLADALARADGARESGSLYALPMPLATAAQAADRLGRWDAALDLCADAVAAAEETGQWGPAATAAAVRARLVAARGQEGQCRADAASALALAESSGVASMAAYAHGALGFLELSLGRVEAAIEELELTERLLAAARMEEPTIIPWAPDLIEAYVRAGRHEPARRVLATLERQAESAGTGGAAALAERCRGLLAGDDFDDHFARARGLSNTPFAARCRSSGRARCWPGACGCTARGAGWRPASVCARPPPRSARWGLLPGRTPPAPSCGPRAVGSAGRSATS